MISAKLRGCLNEGDELSNRYDLLLASHMTASVSSQLDTKLHELNLPNHPFDNCLKKLEMSFLLFFNEKIRKGGVLSPKVI